MHIKNPQCCAGKARSCQLSPKPKAALNVPGEPPNKKTNRVQEVSKLVFYALSTSQLVFYALSTSQLVFYAQSTSQLVFYAQSTSQLVFYTQSTSQMVFYA